MRVTWEYPSDVIAAMKPRTQEQRAQEADELSARIKRTMDRIEKSVQAEIELKQEMKAAYLWCLQNGNPHKQNAEDV